MKTLSHTSHIATIRQANQTQMQQVCQLLGWTLNQYCQHQYYTYEKLIERICYGYPAIAQQMRYSPVFRGFFNQEWALRTQTEFLPFAHDLVQDILQVNHHGQLETILGTPYGDAYLHDEYAYIHNPMLLVNNHAFMHKYNNLLHLI
jgi:hypothetical protein